MPNGGLGLGPSVSIDLTRSIPRRDWGYSDILIFSYTQAWTIFGVQNLEFQYFFFFFFFFFGGGGGGSER